MCCERCTAREPFFTTKSAALSAGLGLPVVYGIVHQLGGTIGVDPSEGLHRRYEHLARRHPGLMVLYVSGYADDAFGREPGSGTAFLSKPFSLETFAHRVSEVLRTV